MSLDLIVGLILALIGALAGAILGHARGKSVGKSEGASEANEAMVATQSKNAAAVARERIRADIDAGSVADDELDRRLSRHDRPG